MLINVFDLHKEIWSSLLARRDRLPHALLLIGQKGLGKYALAREFAAALLCESGAPDGRACGGCLACNWFALGNHPDFRLLQPDALSEEVAAEEGKKKPSQQITIDQVRELDEFLGVGSHRGGLSIVLVNPAEAMNRNAANSILKTLEEPPPNTLFLLVSSDPSRLLPTIRSRCQSIPFVTPSRETATRILGAAGLRDAERWLAVRRGWPWNWRNPGRSPGSTDWRRISLLVARPMRWLVQPNSTRRSRTARAACNSSRLSRPCRNGQSI